jgi:hypothetical protein
MKKILLTILLIASFCVLAAGQDKQIEDIRRIYQETIRKINDAERAFAVAKKDGGPAETNVFLLETQFNKGNTSYPAVGIFREEAKFYFTFGKGENPYPDALLKIETYTHRSAAVEQREYYFDSGGRLIFYFEDPDAENMSKDEEMRIYFAGGKPIRILAGEDDITNVNFRRKAEVVSEILEKQKKLVSVFKNSL